METQKPLLDPSTARSSVQAAYLSQISSEVAPLLPPTSAIPGRYTLHSIVDSVASFIWGEPWTAVGTIKAWFEGLWKVKVEKNTSQLEQTKLVGAAVIARAKELMGAASSQDLTDECADLSHLSTGTEPWPKHLVADCKALLPHQYLHVPSVRPRSPALPFHARSEVPAATRSRPPKPP